MNRRSIAIGLTGLLLGTHVPAQAPLPSIRLICLPGVPLPVLIAQQQGFFAQQGIRVVAEKAADAAALRAALAGGSADLAHASVENAVVAQRSGADYVIVIGGEMSTSELIVQPSIHSVADLRGHTILLDGKNTAYTLLLKKILLRNRLRPGIDCTMKVAGLAPDRLQAMRANPDDAATIEKPPTSILAERAGLHSLGSTDALAGMGRSQGIGGFALRSWAAGHSDLLVRYLAAFVQGQRWMMEPAHKDQVIALMLSHSHMPRNIAEQTYGIDLERAWSPDARFDVSGFRNVLALDREAGAPAPPSPRRCYDSVWYRKALARLSETP